MVYARWRRLLPGWLKLEPVELPGRGARFYEPLHTDLNQLAADLADGIAAKLDRPYAVFGHSLGALLAFEVTLALRVREQPAPVTLFVSGAAAPTRREASIRKFSEPKSDAELIEELRNLGGTPEEAIANEELMSLALPVLRADFLMFGRYRYASHPALNSPVRVFGGRQDKVTPEQLSAWQEQAAQEFSLDMFEGGHFFIQTQEAELLHHVKAYLQRDFRSPPNETNR